MKTILTKLSDDKARDELKKLTLFAVGLSGVSLLVFWFLGGAGLALGARALLLTLHKGNKGKGYGFSTEQYKRHCEWNERGRVYCMDFWLGDKWEKVRNFKWLVEKFWPLKGWPENWEEKIKIDSDKDFSTLKYKGDFWLSNLQEKE